MNTTKVLVTQTSSSKILHNDLPSFHATSFRSLDPITVESRNELDHEGLFQGLPDTAG